jgi:hypothetical protein
MRAGVRSAWALIVTGLVAGSGDGGPGGHEARAADAPAAKEARLQDLVGTWLFVEDRTPNPTADMARMRPPAGPRFTIALEAEVVVLTQTRRDAPHVTRYPLDGSEQVKTERETTRTDSARFERGAWRTENRIEEPGRDPATRVANVVRLTFTPTDGGLLVAQSISGSFRLERVAFYERAADVPDPTPATADLKQLAWLSGAWVGTHGKATSEERWGPPGGGALLGTARTVVEGRMVMFEFLRVVERAGGLVYVAQPGGAPPTEFVLTEISATRAVFENPHHDFPQRIVYAREGERGLVTEISDRHGQRARRFPYTRE